MVAEINQWFYLPLFFEKGLIPCLNEMFKSYWVEGCVCVCMQYKYLRIYIEIYI